MEMFVDLSIFDYIDNMLDSTLRPLVKVNLDQLKIFLYFVKKKKIIFQILSIPVGICMRFLKNSTLRTLYNLFWGAFFILLLARKWFIFINLITISVYIVSKVITKHRFVAVAFISFSALTYAHYIRWIVSSSIKILTQNEDQQWKIDFNVIQMIITCRYIYYAAELEDGKLDTLKPSLFEYLSYIFLFSNIIVGTLPFTDFVNFVRLSQHYKQMNFTLKPAMISALKALIFTVCEMLIRPYFDFRWFETQEWKDMNLVYRITLISVIAFCARFKYFLAFKYTQAAMDGSGITFEIQQDGTYNYTRHLTADYRFEVEYNTRIRTTYWNQTIQNWLKVCFYDRYVSKYGGRVIYLTFIISAWWQQILTQIILRHGLFIIYYFFFIEWALFNEVTKYFYIARQKFTFIPQPVSKLIQCLYCTLIVNGCAIPVAMLQWDRGVRFTNDLYWSPQILIGVCFIFFFVTQWGQEKKQRGKKPKEMIL